MSVKNYSRSEQRTKEKKKAEEEENPLVFSLRCLVALLMRFAECVVLRLGTAPWRIGDGRKGRERKSCQAGVSMRPKTEAIVLEMVS
jgi:hypothetical protein